MHGSAKDLAVIASHHCTSSFAVSLPSHDHAVEISDVHQQNKRKVKLLFGLSELERQMDGVL